MKSAKGVIANSQFSSSENL